jgi:hypothetical protein
VLRSPRAPRALLQSGHGFDLSDPLLQPLQVMILDVFDRDHGSCCTDEDEPPRIENKAASFENAQLGRTDSIEMRAHGTEPSFRLCLTSLVSLANLCPPLHLGAALLGRKAVPVSAARVAHSFCLLHRRGLGPTLLRGPAQVCSEIDHRRHHTVQATGEQARLLTIVHAPL